MIIEGTGLGHTPVFGDGKEGKVNMEILDRITNLVKAGCIVCMSTQTIFGRVNMNVYSNGRKLLDAGVIPCGTMTSETALVKLAWCIKNSKNIKDAKEIFKKNLCGEITETEKPDQFDL